MVQEYYIVTGKSRSGPFDLVSIVRKIRNGSLNALTPLQVGQSSDVKPAGEWEDLAEFFSAQKDERPVAQERHTSEQRGLGETLRVGLRFLQNNQYSTVFSGIFVLLLILVATASGAIPSKLHFFVYAFLSVLSYFVLSCYMLSILRMSRGQPVDSAYMESKIMPGARSLLMASALICFPALLGIVLLTNSASMAGMLLGLLILTVPGLYTLSIYAFTPLLILDKGHEFWEAMELSRKTVLKSGAQNAGLVYALFVINFLGGLCILLPMALTLPITMGALANMYDEMFA